MFHDQDLHLYLKYEPDTDDLNRVTLPIKIN